MISTEQLVSNNMPNDAPPSIIEQNGPPGSADVPAPSDPVSTAADAVVIPLDAQLAGLLDDPRFEVLFPKYDDPSELCAVVEEIQVLIHRCGLHVRLALAKKNWRHLRATRRRRAAMLNGGRRGRPKGAANFSVQQYALGLAMIWFEHTGRQPSRYLATNSRKGCFADFVQLVVDAAPPKFRGSLAGESPSIEYLLRTSVQAFRTARASGDEYRRRGLIGEKDWLDSP